MLINKSKCSFAQPQLGYLGHIISVAGVAIDSTKVLAVQSWLPPKTVKMRGFLGLPG